MFNIRMTLNLKLNKFLRNLFEFYLKLFKFNWKWGSTEIYMMAWWAIIFIVNLFSLSLTLKMAGNDEIKLFQFIQKTYKNIDIHQSEPNGNRSPLNLKNVFILFCHAQFFISSTTYILFNAKSMIEYGMAFFICTSIVASGTVYLVLTWQIKITLNYIENCERFIEKSEYTISTLKSLHFWRPLLTLCFLQEHIQRLCIKVQMTKSNDWLNSSFLHWLQLLPFLCYHL